MEAASKGSLNWKLCCLCQQETDEDVRCPANQKRFHTSYETLEKDLYDLKNANALTAKGYVSAKGLQHAV